MMVSQMLCWARDYTALRVECFEDPRHAQLSNMQKSLCEKDMSLAKIITVKRLFLVYLNASMKRSCQANTRMKFDLGGREADSVL